MNTIEQLKQNLDNQPKEKLVADFIELTNLYVDEIKEHCKTRYEVLQLNKAMDILLPKNEQQTKKNVYVHSSGTICHLYASQERKL